MKRSKLIVLVSFLLMLYIGPMISAEQIINKDFALATEYTTSDQSITSFNETLPDDVLYYPDGDLVSDTVVASSGSSTGEHPAGSYISTHATGGDIYSNDDYNAPHITAINLEFSVPMSASGIAVSFYATYLYQTTTADVNEISVWDGSSWDDYGDISNDQYIPYDETWVNFTISSSYIIDETISIRGYLSNDDNIFIKVDYAEISYVAPITLSSSSYAVSFADVSGFTTSDTSITTDGDVATITENGAGSTGRAYASFASTDFFEYYYEFRIVSMTATTANLEFWDGAAYNTLKTFTSAGTYKGIISDTDATTMQRISFLVGSESGNIKPDYLRISPANETGWQHDGSTTAGVTDDAQAEATYTYSSDGDILTLNVTKTVYLVDNPDVYFLFDTTSTAADVERDYYPFLDVYISSLSEVGCTVYMGFQGDGFRLSGHRLTVGHNRINILSASSADADKTIIWFYGLDCYSVDDSFEIGFDFGKAYSIAIYTVTQSGTSIDDVLYVSDGTLYCSGTSFTSITLDYDPSLSFATNTQADSTWTMTTTSGTPYIDFYITDWLGYTNDTSGSFPSGTLTDTRIKFTATANIQAITFFSPIPGWNIKGPAELLINAPFDYWAFNMFLILFGLVLVVASGCYLAYCIKGDMSQDKLFYFLIAFMFGWGLFLGGMLL